MKPIRRVVSGHDERGRSVIAMDSEIGNLIGDDHEAAGALALAELWSTAEMPIDNSGARDQARPSFDLLPAPHGSLLRLRVSGRRESREEIAVMIGPPVMLSILMLSVSS